MNVRNFPRIKRRKKRRTLLIPLILASILFHFILLVSIILYNSFNIDIQTAKKDEKKQPEYIEITEVPVPKEKETKPPEVPKRLAERSHRTDQEKTRDEFTKQSSTTPPLPKPVPAAKPKPKPQQKQVKKAQPKPEEKIVKQPERKNVREQIRNPKLLREKTLAALPKEQLKEQRKEPKSVNRENSKTELPNLTKEQLFNAAQTPPQQQARQPNDLLGARDVNKKEDTVDLNTTEFKYLSYFTKLKRQIEGVWNYPEISRARGEQGELFLTFTIRRSGALDNIRLIRSSGYARLDNEAMTAIREASPFSPFPASWGSLEKLNIRASFRYSFGWSIR